MNNLYATIFNSYF